MIGISDVNLDMPLTQDVQYMVKSFGKLVVDQEENNNSLSR